MLCYMKMWFMLFLWHGDVRPGPLWFIFMKWHRCWYAGGWLGGFAGGGGVRTFLIVRSWWFIFIEWSAVHFYVLHELRCLLLVHVHEVTYVLIRCALFVVHELICFLIVHVHEVRANTVALSSLAKCEDRRSEDRVELLERSKLISCGHGAHLWPCKDTYRWPAQSTAVQPSISICMEKEQCRQGLVPAIGHGTEKLTIKAILLKQIKFWKWWGAESPANTIESVFWTPASWHFVAIFKVAMFIKHCEGWKIHCTLLLKMLILSGASSPRVTMFETSWTDWDQNRFPRFPKKGLLTMIISRYIKQNCELSMSHIVDWPYTLW